MSYLCSQEQFDQLLAHLKGEGRKLFGPTKRYEVITVLEIDSAQDLPIGMTDEQEPGFYRIKPREDKAYFGFRSPQDTWKKLFFPACETLWTMDKDAKGCVTFHETSAPDEKWALIGIHPCDLSALLVLDRVFNKQLANYRQYHKRRENTFVLAANCTSSASTCFCTSMGTGPKAQEGYDIALTEVINAKEHYFILQCGTKQGEDLCKKLALSPAPEVACKTADSLIEKNKKQQVRKVDAANLHKMLQNKWHHPRWDNVAERCINCSNCTMSCPTCFCNNLHDNVSIDGSHVDRIQSWESCFNLSHSYAHGGSVRHSAKSRYRQWLTHKFGTWWDQFGLSGCVGCGRCITWCPVGIDVTEELHELGKK